MKLTVNGQEVEVITDPTKPLLNVLREDLGLTGSKEGCGKGECGACTVLLDGKPVTSCLVLAVQAEGKEIITIEGLDTFKEYPVLEEAFVEEGAVQCGFCIPGFMVSATYLLKSNPNPSKEEIREAISGNLCRCTGYSKIIRAIERARDELSRMLVRGDKNG